jgi:hypothetical protein
MKIQTPATLTSDQIAWEGELVPPEEVTLGTKGTRPAARAALGKPVWWPAAAAVAGETGNTWTPPAGDRRYTLIRLSCTLYPPRHRRTHYQEAHLRVRLKSVDGNGRVVAHDLYPDKITTPAQGKYSIKLSPALKFVKAIDLSLGELGAEIAYERALPVAQSYGQGGNTPEWRFTHQPAHPLQGDISVYLVSDAPADVDAWLELDLVATLSTTYGPLTVASPDPVTAHIAQTTR